MSISQGGSSQPSSREAPLSKRPLTDAPLRPSERYAGARLVVVGGTGFLGKVWVSMLLHRFPDVGKLYLLVRPKAGQTAEERFWSEITTSPTFDPLREAHPGADFERFLRDKVEPIAGDIVRPLLGIDDAIVARLAGNVEAVVNVSGVVDFNPPLDEALEVNAFGVSNIVALARRLGAPVMHTSTCYVAGYRTGVIEEDDPRTVPFPRAKGDRLLGEYQPTRRLERSHWDPSGEIDECLDLVRMARHRADDAFRQSAFVDEAKKSLEARGEPSSGKVLEEELAKVKRRFVEKQLTDSGMERAIFWGFSNIYTYTKSIGEQVLAHSGLPFTIVRPAVVESSCEYPFPGWNEGINTSAPFIYMALKGTVRFPGATNVHLDIIPVDLVASGMLASLAELLDGTHAPVYQYGVTDTNPCSMARYLEIIGLYKRKKVFEGKSTRLFEVASAHFESLGVDKKTYTRFSPHQTANVMRGTASVLGKLAVGPLASVLKPAAKALESAAKVEDKSGDIMDLFVPFTAESDWVFSCANTRRAIERMPEAERARFIWYPEKIEWRSWMYEVHLPGLEKWILPQIDERMKRELKALRPYEDLLSMLDEVSSRFEHALALSQVHDDGLSRITYRELGDASFAVAEALLDRGVGPGDRVLLAGQNQPAWPMAYFGILRAGAVVVPFDPAMESAQVVNVARAANPKAIVLDADVDGRSGAELRAALPGIATLTLEEIAAIDTHGARRARERFAERRVPAASGDDVASVIYTSGTTGTPKGVMLMHKNFTALLASLAPIFPLGQRDRVLSVLPLHHTFEFTCGMLLPLMLGARIVYVRELSADGLREGFSRTRITAMAGVPALWQMLERRILSEVREKGPLAMRAFDTALELNRLIGKTTGMNAGRLFFGSVHDRFGGNMRHLISGGAALPRDTAKLFSGLGLPLSEGYGLTEAAPVLTVAKAGAKSAIGTVGKPVPGVEIKIAAPDRDGVGEVLARGQNIMKGYAEDPEATALAIDEDGWLHTGDLGKIDRKGNLVIVGRSKDVIVNASGENVYPDDVEALLSKVDGVKELVVVGIPDAGGGERVACLAVPDFAADAPAEERHEAKKRAQAGLRDAFAKLPAHARPAVVHLYEADLPRTATRKVKRAEVKPILERLAEATAPASREGGVSAVRHVLATISQKPLRDIQGSSTLRGDLGIDSLLSVELAVALESQLGRAVDGKALAAAETVSDLELALRKVSSSAEIAVAESEVADDAIQVPAVITETAKRVMEKFQLGFYDRVMKPTVKGRAYIPHNRNTIVASNHASHLDMGFVKYALGSYGTDIVSLAAQDYFFEGDKWRRFYIENLTNLAPFDRKGGLRHALRLAGDHLEQGRTILIFPEGTRSSDGSISEFKPAVGHLALSHGVDILPVYIGGTYEAMKKGTKVPTKREISARIGPPLEVDQLRRLTASMKLPAASRYVAELAERAVRELREGRILDISQLEPPAPEQSGKRPAAREHPLVTLFRELETRYKSGVVDRPITYYFTLGTTNFDKWTLRIDENGCKAELGRPSADADCVLKTTPEIFTKIVKEAYVPSPVEFMSGAIKSNDVSLLMTFQKVFALS